MCCGEKRAITRKMMICVTVLLFYFMTIVPIAAAADSTDYIIMYKSFLKDIQEKRYQKVWDDLTVASKRLIAKTMADELIAMNKGYTQAEVYTMFERDTQNLRTNFFNFFNIELEKTSFLSQLQTAQYSVKSSTKERVVLAITLKGESKDYQIIHEDGKWKMNFFDDFYR
jgi:hypothetical protein